MRHRARLLPLLAPFALACGSNDPMVADMLAYEPPKKLYPEPFMTLGARGRLWWMHRRAGRDL